MIQCNQEKNNEYKHITLQFNSRVLKFENNENTFITSKMQLTLDTLDPLNKARPTFSQKKKKHKHNLSLKKLM